MLTIEPPFLFFAITDPKCLEHNQAPVKPTEISFSHKFKGKFSNEKNFYLSGFQFLDYWLHY